ncbi:hypothetical protein [Candidatus Berkiella aquae]|uniref:Uncharacterized protein n=1 Tax=Candidatus Berkiella aquae TaxID=295108 RepID=A0A0Q9YQ13_9GAMM|nr:hypothetical protein [Candidatus Berkiella aquae]MCS5711027.1 hypothetical protein [Candidatus Berkiella aquae]
MKRGPTEELNNPAKKARTNNEPATQQTNYTVPAVGALAGLGWAGFTLGFGSAVVTPLTAIATLATTTGIATAGAAMINTAYNYLTQPAAEANTQTNVIDSESSDESDHTYQEENSVSAENSAEYSADSLESKEIADLEITAEKSESSDESDHSFQEENSVGSENSDQYSADSLDSKELVDLTKSADSKIKSSASKKSSSIEDSVEEKSYKQLARELNELIGTEKQNKTSFGNFQKLAKGTEKGNREQVWHYAYKSLRKLENAHTRGEISDVKKHYEAKARKFVNK